MTTGRPCCGEVQALTSLTALRFNHPQDSLAFCLALCDGNLNRAVRHQLGLCTQIRQWQAPHLAVAAVPGTKSSSPTFPIASLGVYCLSSILQSSCRGGATVVIHLMCIIWPFTALYACSASFVAAVATTASTEQQPSTCRTNNVGLRRLCDRLLLLFG
jgi:hypothetical protein